MLAVPLTGLSCAGLLHREGSGKFYRARSRLYREYVTNGSLFGPFLMLVLGCINGNMFRRKYSFSGVF